MSKPSPIDIQDKKISKSVKDAENVVAELLPVFDDDEQLDLPPTKPIVRFDESKLESKPITHEDVIDDFTFARNTMHNLIENGQTALAELLRVAMLSDHPRAFEVVSTLMKNISEMTKDMLGLQEKMIDMQIKSKPPGQSDENESKPNVGYSGTTAELLNEIEESRKKANEKK